MLSFVPEKISIASNLILETSKTRLESDNVPVTMRINSIYSQDHCCEKGGASIFYLSDPANHAIFQRAYYSLPVGTQSPVVQNRVNLRRSVREEPPPLPARLRKHRHGWTLDFVRPLEGQGCGGVRLASLFLLLLALLGIGAIALYILCEPEKLQIIQQYLNLSSSSSLKSASVVRPPVNGSLFISDILTNDSIASPPSEIEVKEESEIKIETTVMPLDNYTRYCDDCLDSEVCVALISEEVPICRAVLDKEDPTGCGGLCLVNKQKCHRLDVDAFRCVEIEHYCLDDEWRCSNSLCIPLTKRCDGHMNCYDHSDEYDCECHLDTHFQCGNETSCLPLGRKCDGRVDCWDASDEIHCTLGRNLGWSCPSENRFTCSNGECILKARFCDGLVDCEDGSDEPHGCQGRCNKHEFTCENKRCITKSLRCNSVDDCGDGTDEKYCKDRRS